MANTFGADILIQAPDLKRAVAFYTEKLGFAVTAETPTLITVHGQSINLFIEQGPAIGPILEVFVDDVDAARKQLVDAGCTVIKDEPAFPRCYVRDPFGLTYNISKAGS
jgi:catechol 2,3-dioxygenase-like lactoylglutathione lyase family enzyme